MTEHGRRTGYADQSSQPASSPISDIRGSEAFRRDMVRVVARRTIEQLCGLTSAEKHVA